MVTQNRPRQFRFWIRYLEMASLFFAGLGVMWALLGRFDPLGLYDRLMTKAFFGAGSSLPPDAERVFRFILGPFGATSAGYFVLQWFIVRHALSRREPWAWWAVTLAFMGWFILDTALSLYHGAYFNIGLANLPALLVMLPALLATRPAATT